MADLDANKCAKFTDLETEALLRGIKAHRDTVVTTTPFSVNGSMENGAPPISLRNKKLAWLDIVRRVNDVGMCENRTMAQIKYRWKNLKQRAYKDYSQLLSGDTDQQFKQGDFTQIVLDLIGHERAKSVCTGGGASRKRPLSPKTSPVPIQFIKVDPDLSKTQDPDVEVIPEETSVSEVVSTPGPPPRKKTRRANMLLGISRASSLTSRPQTQERMGTRLFRLNNNRKPLSDSRLIEVEVERAQAETRLAEEQTKLTVLRQQETKLRVLLLQARLQDAGVDLEDVEEVDVAENGEDEVYF